MSDYIKREDAINALKNAFDTVPMPYAIAEGILKDVPYADVVSRKDYESMEHTVAVLNAEIMSNIMSRVKALTAPNPFADVVEVVRCKDCRYWRSDGECIMHSNYTINAIYGADENDYCSYGERKDGERTIFIDETIDETCGYGKDGESE